MARLPRVRFSVIEIPDDASGERGLPRPPREVKPSEDPLLARLLVHCARRALSSGPLSEDEDGGEIASERGANSAGRLALRGEAPPPLGESFDLPTQHQRWPRRDDAPRRPR
ncbi:MAG: hypothetical protein JNG90_10045 [Planctomycetaceae bacterium]|nr:hypothetical protein [Planctomycetaceae bacterium]